MMNVGENRAQNGVRMLPESRNEVKNQNVDESDVGRYAPGQAPSWGGVKPHIYRLKSSFQSLPNIPIVPRIVFSSPDRCYTRRTPSDQSRSRSSRKCDFEVPAAVGRMLSTAV
ncbi:hypothetical protein E3N88_18865 [Mikania micrantha]|uniref:Uncharacterized protein n=1 Tax=Mikania micrantha TaxID=192012 RepID=A0A5N6NN00_9ASTR|nr:hypothetical protein E3N88_18865 [Mikania micrantha]